LRIVRFVDAACVHPEVFEFVLLRLLAAEPDLRMASLVLERLVFEILENDLVLLVFPRMREDCVVRDVILTILSQAELALIVEF
jgi:hypothetical protein